MKSKWVVDLQLSQGWFADLLFYSARKRFGDQVWAVVVGCNFFLTELGHTSYAWKVHDLLEIGCFQEV